MQQYNQFRDIIHLEELSMIKIGKIIKAKRKERHLTQEELASILGVSKAAISKWENAECYPDIVLLPKIADTFYITIDDLFDYKKQDKPLQIINEYSFGLSLSDIDMALLDHGTIKSCDLVKTQHRYRDQPIETWEVRVQLVSTEDNFPQTIQKYIKPNTLIDGSSIRLVDGKSIMDAKPNKYYVCKEKVWEYNNADHKYLKQMIREQITMGLIEEDNI